MTFDLWKFCEKGFCARITPKLQGRRLLVHQWICRGRAVPKLSAGDVAIITIGVRTRCVPEKKIVGVGMLLSSKVCYVGIVLDK
jgi:hypothetical protein